MRTGSYQHMSINENWYLQSAHVGNGTVRSHVNGNFAAVQHSIQQIIVLQFEQTPGWPSQANLQLKNPLFGRVVDGTAPGWRTEHRDQCHKLYSDHEVEGGHNDGVQAQEN